MEKETNNTEAQTKNNSNRETVISGQYKNYSEFQEYAIDNCTIIENFEEDVGEVDITDSLWDIKYTAYCLRDNVTC